jgi:hypothetical protein
MHEGDQSESPRALSPVDALSVERRRLLEGVDAAEIAIGIGTWHYWFYCFENADCVLRRVKELMLLVNTDAVGARWPSDRQWLQQLPKWFLQAGKKEMPTPDEERIRQAIAEKWGKDHPTWPFPPCDHMTPLQWVHGMRPGATPGSRRNDERIWYWWDALVVEPDIIKAAIDHLDMPVASPFYRWAFNAAGAVAFYDSFPWKL